LPVVLAQSHVFSRLLKCPPERFQGIVHGTGAGFLRPEDGSSQDLADGVDSVRRVSCQVRPCSHPSDECAAPFGPGPEETGAGAFELGAEDDEALDFGRFDRDEPLRDGGQEPTVLEDRAQEEGVIGHGNPGIELLLVLGLRISGQLAAPRPCSWMRDIRLPEQVQGFPELLLGRFGRRSPKPELSGHECGGGVIEADEGPGVGVEGASYGLDGGLERMTGG